MDVAVSLDLPEQLAVLGAERVEMRVVRPDEDPISGHDRRRLQLAIGLERPGRLSARGVDRVQHAGEVAHVDETAGNGRRRFADAVRRRFVLPLDRAVSQTDRVELTRPATRHRRHRSQWQRRTRSRRRRHRSTAASAWRAASAAVLPLKEADPRNCGQLSAGAEAGTGACAAECRDRHDTQASANDGEPFTTVSSPRVATASGQSSQCWREIDRRGQHESAAGAWTLRRSRTGSDRRRSFRLRRTWRPSPSARTAGCG